MGIARKVDIDNLLVFLFLILFPFGQIIRIGVLQPLDIATGLAAAWVIYKKYKQPNVFKYIKNFLIVALFSWIALAAFFKQVEVLYGLLYLVRLFAYFYLFVFVWNFVAKSKANKLLVSNSLIMISLTSAVFGWIQYFMFPAFHALLVWGWDEHLYRLAGTFLDPSFLGIIIVLGVIVLVNKFIETRNRKLILLIIFLLVSLAFTFSRASYLALAVGILTIGFYQKWLRQAVYILLLLLLLITILPTRGNKILTVTREFSAAARISNYSETLKIILRFPLFGVGYDNLCMVKSNTPGYLNLASHSCSGSDSSLLFIFATTGIIGLMAFISFATNALYQTRFNPLFTSSFAALIVHSTFSNSLVYPWALSFLLIILAVSLKE